MSLRLRLLLTWLLLAAIPLQGFAAASMLFCGPGTEHGVVAQAQPMEPMQFAHSPAGQGGHAEHAGHTQADTAQPLPDATHECGVCASCSHGVAIAQAPALLAFSQPTRTEAVEPFVLIHPRPSQAPDRPPRI